MVVSLLLGSHSVQISWHICVLGEGLAQEPSFFFTSLFFSSNFVISKIWQTFLQYETKFVGKSLLLYVPVKTSIDFSHAKNPKFYGTTGKGTKRSKHALGLFAVPHVHHVQQHHVQQ